MDACLCNGYLKERNETKQNKITEFSSNIKKDGRDEKNRSTKVNFFA
jgi:hypothetical protein